MGLGLLRSLMRFVGRFEFVDERNKDGYNELDEHEDGERERVEDDDLVKDATEESGEDESCEVTGDEGSEPSGVLGRGVVVVVMDGIENGSDETTNGVDNAKEEDELAGGSEGGG